MGLDLEFSRISATHHTYHSDQPLVRAVHEIRGFLKNMALEESWHREGMFKAILSAAATFLTTNADIEIDYNDHMQAYAERFEWMLLQQTLPSREDDPKERMRVMEMVMEFEPHSASDLAAFMQSDAYKGYQRHDKDQLQAARDRRRLQSDAYYQEFTTLS